MNKFFNHQLNSNNIIFKFLVFFILIVYGYYTFQLNQYEILFVDERVIIDDIYNIWLIDDPFNRFLNVENKLLQKIAIITTELAYGGDLRYGRLWSNLFSLTVGPFTLLGDSFVITISRLLNIFLYFFSGYLLSKTFLKENKRWLFLIAFYSIPGVDMYQRFPKSDVLALLFSSFALNFLVKKQYLKAILFMSIATFIKINFIILYFTIFLFIFYRYKQKTKLVLKTFFITIASLIIVNPILLIPPLTLFGIKLPNFYEIYLNWLISQGSYGQNKLIDSKRLFKWTEEIGESFFISDNINFVFFVFLLSFSIFVLICSYSKRDYHSLLFAVTFFTYLFFYLFFIDRTFIWYLNLPFVLLLIASFRNLEKIKFKTVKILLLIFIFSGVFSNLYSHINDKKFVANSMLGYENVPNSVSAINQLNETVNVLERILFENNKKNTVYWNPNLFIPRNGVTYNGDFYIRELWGVGELESLLDEDYVYVTNEILSLKNIKQFKAFNYIIYYK